VFFVQNVGAKNYKAAQSVFVRNFGTKNALLYVKRVCKMLMKLTPGILYEHLATMTDKDEQLSMKTE